MYRLLLAALTKLQQEKNFFYKELLCTLALLETEGK